MKAQQIVGIQIVLACLVGSVPYVDGQTFEGFSAFARASPSLREQQLPSTQRHILKALGDRLQKSGNELVTMTGSLETYSGGQKTSTNPISVLWQFPGLLRLDYTALKQTIIFDGLNTTKVNGSLSQADFDLVEALAKDNGDSFVLGEAIGSRVHLIGRSLNIHDSRTQNQLSGLCTLFALEEHTGIQGAAATTIKSFCFDPQTDLLKSVTYRSNGSTIETRPDTWITKDPYPWPSQIQRFADGQLTMKVIFSAVSTGPKADPSAFVGH